MNRRGFLSLLMGAAGAPLVPWRQLIEPLIILPAAFQLVPITGMYAREIAVPEGWIEGPFSPFSIRSDRLELLQAHYAKRMGFVDVRSTSSIRMALR